MLRVGHLGTDHWGLSFGPACVAHCSQRSVGVAVAKDGKKGAEDDPKVEPQ
jgi:hypothetical protein